MVNPPNLLKVVLFTFNIILIESIYVLLKLLFENWNKSKFGVGIEEIMKSNFMENPPNLLKFVHFTFNIPLINRIYLSTFPSYYLKIEKKKI